MENKANRPPETRMLLRLLGGGYLLYLAWDIRGSIAQRPIFWLPVLGFAVIGAALLGTSLWQLAHHRYFRREEPKTMDECEDSNDE